MKARAASGARLIWPSRCQTGKLTSAATTATVVSRWIERRQRLPDIGFDAGIHGSLEEIEFWYQRAVTRHQCQPVRAAPMEGIYLLDKLGEPFCGVA